MNQSNEDVAAMAERVEAGTINVQAQIEKFGNDALAAIDKLQNENRALRAALVRIRDKSMSFISKDGIDITKIAKAALEANAPERPKAYGPGMTEHASDCQCYVCAKQLCPHCGKSEPHTHRVPGSAEPVVFPHE